jgi:hypothetical protein
MGFEKINLDIEMDFTNLEFSFEILKFYIFFLLDIFTLSVMVLQCAVVKSCLLSFQLH